MSYIKQSEWHLI